MNEEQAIAFLKGFIQRDLLGSVHGETTSDDFKDARKVLGEDKYFELLDEQVLYFKSNHI